jgi:protoheme IX farnesyltransferase
VPGAIPPLIGWAVAAGSLSIGAWLLFAWMFLWQHPHFFALAFLYEDDYRAAGMPMLSVKLGRNSMVEKQMVLFTLLLVPIPLLLVPLTKAGTLTLIAAPLLGLGYLAVVLRELIKGTTDRTARASFTASVIYLGLVFLVMVIDAGLAGFRS